MKSAFLFGPLNLFLVKFTLAAWTEVYNYDAGLVCTFKTAKGVNTCCCDDTTCAGKGWESPCHGDLAQPACTTDQLIGPYGQGDGFNYTEVSAGTCGGPSCDFSYWTYNWTCCDKPVLGNYISYYGNGGPPSPSCPMPPFFIGCTLPNEVLINDNTACANTTCPNVSIVTSTYMTGNQAVVASGFTAALNSLVTCAKNLGSKARLEIQGTSECAKPITTGENATNSISAHQVGMATDAILILPDGSTCNRTCMAQGYCACHQTSPTCASSTNCPSCHGQPQNQRNQWINNFFTCAHNIAHLKVGATFTPANWNVSNFKQHTPMAPHTNLIMHSTSNYPWPRIQRMHYKTMLLN